MLLSEYMSNITSVINQLAGTGLIATSNISVDFRTDKIGLVKGLIVFVDQSRLFFTEYLDVKYKIDKLSYSFHYQDKHDSLVFRYDNAAHRPSLNFKDHKHVGNAILQSDIPNLEDVIQEVMIKIMQQQE